MFGISSTPRGMMLFWFSSLKVFLVRYQFDYANLTVFHITLWYLFFCDKTLWYFTPVGFSRRGVYLVVVSACVNFIRPEVVHDMLIFNKSE
jgi:hypothetical protein